MANVIYTLFIYNKTWTLSSSMIFRFVSPGRGWMLTAAPRRFDASLSTWHQSGTCVVWRQMTSVGRWITQRFHFPMSSQACREISTDKLAINKTINTKPRQIKVLSTNQSMCHYINNTKQYLQDNNNTSIERLAGGSVSQKNVGFHFRIQQKIYVQ